MIDDFDEVDSQTKQTLHVVSNVNNFAQSNQTTPIDDATSSQSEKPKLNR